MKKMIFAVFLLNGIFLSPMVFADHDEYEDSYYYGYGPSGYYAYDYHPYYNHGVYSTGYYYDPRAAYYGHYEEGAGVHVPTGSYASPYDHGVHHGYHYSEEEGWHSGLHYGHE